MKRKEHIGFYFKKINDFLQTQSNLHLKKVDLTYSQLYILMYVFHSETGTVLQKDIEQHFKLKHPTVIGLLKRMEKKNLIHVETNPDDRRSNRVVILDRGISIGKEMLFGRDYADNLLTANLDENQKKELEDLLRIIYKNIYKDDCSIKN